ncbi:type I secretion system protein TolC [Thiomonas sp. FB-6]|uniref:type I secretion system protein TolC n=1 Tax=Thiomonas sp. FB-6 TaxID=1158291 RepID=UPI0018C8DE50|nr:type I secretion system protein TolC [Thiomonas sp. FB-6]
MRSTIAWKLLALVAGLLLLTCELSGCAAPRAPAGRCVPAARAQAQPAPVPWWNEAGDPVLARLVDSALTHDPRLRRQAAELEAARARSAQWSYRLHAWLGGLLGYPVQDPRLRASRLAEARQRKAQAVALDYLKLRRLQAVLALGQQFQDQFRDNADIARWRREAGLASAVDGGLAGAMLGVNSSALDAERERLSAAVATLAQACGMSGQDLESVVDDGAGVPRLLAPPTDSLPHGDARAASRLAALQRVAAREEALRGVERDALRNAADARAAYQLGTGGFAAVYAAEASALAAREARVLLRAEAARATVHLWALRQRELDAVPGVASGVPDPAPAAGATAGECGHG